MATLAPDTTQPGLLDAFVRDEPREAAVHAARDAAGRPDASGATLEHLVAGAWSALAVAGAATCPVCSGDVRPRYGAGPRPVAGACGSCGTEIA